MFNLNWNEDIECVYYQKILNGKQFFCQDHQDTFVVNLFLLKNTEIYFFPAFQK